MNDLDELITTSLRERASAQVDPTRLLSGATARGRSRLLRRRVAIGAALATTVAITIGVMATGPAWWGAIDRDPDVGASPEADAGRLPEAPGVPGAADRPDLVGTDPSLLHFDAPTLTATAQSYTWTSGEDYEQLEVILSPVGLPSIAHQRGLPELVPHAVISIGTDAALQEAVERRGGPASSVTGVQLAPGVWLRIEAPTDAIAQVVADAVRLDRAQRCVLPFQLTSKPDGATVTTCSVGFLRAAVGLDGVPYPPTFAQASVLIADSDGSTMGIQAQAAPDPTVGREANHTSGDRPAFLYPSLDEVELLGYPGLYLSARIGKAYQGFAVADADLVLGGLNVSSDAQRIETWPDRLVAG